MAFFFMKLFRVIIVISLIGSLIHYLINNKNYTFRAIDVRKVAEKFVGQHPNQCLEKIAADLRRKKYAHIIPDNEQEWVISSRGGLRGKQVLLHSSLTEMIYVWGSPMRTSGHAGVHWANISVTVLTGSVQVHKSGSSSGRSDVGPGESFSLKMFDPALIEYSEDTWTLVYAKGFIPFSYWYNFADAMISSGDVISPAKLSLISGRSILREAALYIQENIERLTGKKKG